MSWAFWRRAIQDEPEPKARFDTDQPPPEMDLNEMFAAPPPATPKQPDWLDTTALEENNAPAPRPYLDVDLNKLQRKRLEKEAEGLFTARLKRGDVGMSDIPLTGAVGSLINRITEFLFRPIQGVFSNPNLVVSAIVLLGGTGIVALAYKDLFDWFFAALLN